MKNKIAWKLSIYFAVSLILFSIIIGGVYTSLFKNHTILLHKTDLEKRAITMADNLSEYMSGTYSSSGMMGGRQGGYGSYIRLLDEIAMTDVWIVDENSQLILNEKMAKKNYQYMDLPQDAELVVKDVFLGTTSFSEGFSDLLNTPTLTVGTPIRSGDQIIGALLLHSPVEGMNDAIKQGFNILAVSMLTALVLSTLLSIFMALIFTKPLKSMKSTAVSLANGDYSVKTNVKQNDEIGELARAIDILSERLELASQESEKLLKLRRDFVANISHELRTPVTVIRGSLEALCDGVVTDQEQVKTYHAQMLNDSVLLQRLVDDLLELSKLQNIDFKMDMQDINLCDVLHDIVRSMQNIAKVKNIKFHFKQDTKIFMMKGDYGRLRQMLLIIVDNAIKFSPHDSLVTISFENRIISIADQGIGIAKEDLPYIFDRFYKINDEENKNGTGLGLAIAKQIADRHQIEISVKSIQGKGSSFQFMV